MRFAGYFKQLGDLLDTADDHATNNDLQTGLQTLTRGTFEAASAATVATVAAAKEGASERLQDLGIREGWSDLTTQIRGDLQGVASQVPAVLGESGSALNASPSAAEASSSPEPGGSSAAAARAAAIGGDGRSRGCSRLDGLRERVSELEAREKERLEAQATLRKRFEEAEAELQGLSAASAADAAAEAAGCPVRDADGEHLASDGATDRVSRMEEMQLEFQKMHGAAEERSARLDAELLDFQGQWEPLEAELEFWRKKVQRTLAARNLTSMPSDLRRAAERRCAAEEAGQEAPGATASAASCESGGEEDSDSGGDEESEEEAVSSEAAALREVRAVQEALEEELVEHQRAYGEAERRLGEVMRDSDVALSAADTERGRERALAAKLAVAKAAAAAHAAAAEEAARGEEEARLVLAEAEGRRAEAKHAAATVAPQADAGSDDAGAAEVASLRREVDALQRCAHELAKDNAAMEGRLRACRAFAAAELERAVPLESQSCWHYIDGPTMKAVVLLVRSACLRKAFAVHLVGTYAWLFFLVFWLEHRGH